MQKKPIRAEDTQKRKKNKSLQKLSWVRKNRLEVHCMHAELGGIVKYHTLGAIR